MALFASPPGGVCGRGGWRVRALSVVATCCGVQVVALGDEDAEIIRVTVPGDPEGARGEMVPLTI
jgi:hypothetical protein